MTRRMSGYDKKNTNEEYDMMVNKTKTKLIAVNGTAEDHVPLPITCGEIASVSKYQKTASAAGCILLISVQKHASD